jgi:hypothetical protein
MIRLKELKRNPVSARYVEETSGVYEIVAERLPQGRMLIVCSCPGEREGGWCRHIIGALCDRGQFEREEDRVAFNQVVMGTALEKAALELEFNLDRFATSYREMMERRPKALSVEQLEEFGRAAAAAAKYAVYLSGAIDRFVHRMEPESEDVGAS